MASGDGKTSPFNSDGKSGATGNGEGGKFKGLDGHRGPDIPQRMGATNFNPDSVPKDGRVLKLDPPSDRQGLVGQTVKGMTGKKPFKLTSNGPEMPEANADPDEGGPVGDIPNSDAPDNTV